ncbi:MAG: zinc ABC transporter substrate-binding protein [Verrucomicrobia bacterium]|nr:zinc ABC transporter substrate-binding protein [Verrucomicrobiota bacterium]
MRIFLILCILFFSCTSNAPSTFKGEGRIKVLSTTAMIDDLVSQIGKDRIDHLVLITGEIDPHSYNLVKGDDEKLSQANVVFANGLNLEHGASLKYQLQHHSHVIFIGDEIGKKSPERMIVVGSVTDPHVWMDISLWAEGIDSIVSALAEVDPENRQFYHENAALLFEKMMAAHREVKDQLSEVPEDKRYLVTSHDAFNYFTRAYLGADWEQRCIAPEGLAPEGQISSVDIQRVVEYICKHHVEVIFPESNVSRDALKKITTACGRTIRMSKMALYGDAMGGVGSGADSYLKMIEHDARVLKEEWKK